MKYKLAAMGLAAALAVAPLAPAEASSYHNDHHDNRGGWNNGHNYHHKSSNDALWLGLLGGMFAAALQPTHVHYVEPRPVYRPVPVYYHPQVYYPARVYVAHGYGY